MNEPILNDINFMNRKFKRKEIPKHLRKYIIERDLLYCKICFKKLDVKDKNGTINIINGVFHHIIPLIYKGENAIDNITILCKECHNQLHSGSENKEKYLKHYQEFQEFGIIIIQDINL